MGRRYLATVGIGLLLAGSAGAWTPDSQARIAREAGALAPDDLARQIRRHPRELRAGALAPFRGTEATDHYWHEDGAGDLDRVLFREVEEAIASIRTHRTFEEIVYRLGRVSHWVADANNPLNASGDDPQEGRYYADYLAYAQSAEPRFSLVFYAEEPTVGSDREMRLMTYRALWRGRRLYPLVGAEYRRIDYGAGLLTFDDRSTAFGVAAVSYSHAISDIARVFRYIWLAAGGADDRAWLWAHRDGVVLLPRAPEAR